MVSRLNYIIHSKKISNLIYGNRKIILFLLFLIIASAFLRFYNLSHLLYWMFDEERDAFFVKKIIFDHRPLLIGGAIPQGFYLAPGYFYISSIFYLFSTGNPLGPAIFASTLGVISTILIFVVTLKLFDKKTSVFSSLIYAFSYLTIAYNRTWWALAFGPTLALLTYFCIFKLSQKFQVKWIYILTLTFIVGVQTDPSNFALIVLTLIAWKVLKLPFKNRHIFFGILIFLMSHISLLIFDIRHDFYNLNHLINFLKFKNQTGSFDLGLTLKGLLIFPQTFSRFVFFSTSPDMALQITPDKFYHNLRVLSVIPIILVVCISSLGYFILSMLTNFKNKKSIGLWIVGTHILISLFGVLIYNLFSPGYTNEWFFQVLFPAFAIVLGYALAQLGRIKALNFLAFAIIAVYAFLGFITILNARNSYNFADKADAVKWSISQLHGDEFSLDSIGKNFNWGGYRYLYFLYGHEPVKSYMDPTLAGWLYPKETLSSSHPNKVVVIANPDFFFDSKYYTTYQKYLGKTVNKRNFGRIEVLIVDNSNKWVDW